MSTMCRLLGHAPSARKMKMDPTSFEPETRCKRCGVKIGHADGEWKEVVEGSDRSAAE